MASMYAKSERLKYFCKLLLDKYRVRCNFCGEILDGLDLYAKKSGKSRDDMTVHHLDENRDNNHPDNLVFSHRKCHLRFHRQKEKRAREVRYNILMAEIYADEGK